MPPAARGKAIEVWFQDEARVGQQGTVTRVWLKRGSRPRAPRDRRHTWAWLFGAACPARGVGAALAPPEVNAEATGLHLAEIGRRVAPGAHAVVLATAPAGISRAAAWWCPGTSPCCRCRPTRLS